MDIYGPMSQNHEKTLVATVAVNQKICWDSWVLIPIKLIIIGFDPPPNVPFWGFVSHHLQSFFVGDLKELGDVTN